MILKLLINIWLCKVGIELFLDFLLNFLVLSVNEDNIFHSLLSQACLFVLTGVIQQKIDDISVISVFKEEEFKCLLVYCALVIYEGLKNVFNEGVSVICAQTLNWKDSTEDMQILA